MNGTRMPPSQVWRFEPRSGVLVEPLIVVPAIVGPPLSLKKKTSVFSSSPSARERGERSADGVVHRRHHGGIGAALLVGDVREPRQVLLGRLHRRVDGVEGQIEEERPRFSRLMNATARR